MRIPKRIDSAWDWAERNAQLVVLVALGVIAAVLSVVLPMVASFFVGAGIGGYAVYLWARRKMGELRREIDDLLRENGALRHRATVPSGSIVQADAGEADDLLTLRIPVIPSEQPRPAPVVEPRSETGPDAESTKSLDVDEEELDRAVAQADSDRSATPKAGRSKGDLGPEDTVIDTTRVDLRVMSG